MITRQQKVFRARVIGARAPRFCSRDGPSLVVLLRTSAFGRFGGVAFVVCVREGDGFFLFLRVKSCACNHRRLASGGIERVEARKQARTRRVG